MASLGGSSKPPLPLSYVRGALLAIPPPNTSEYKQFETRFKANLVFTAHYRAPGYLKQARRALLVSLRHELKEFDRHLFERRYMVTEKDQDRRQHLVRALETLEKLLRGEEEEEKRQRERARMGWSVGMKGPSESTPVVKESEGLRDLIKAEKDGMVDVTSELVSYLREGLRGDTQPYVHPDVRKPAPEKEHGNVADECGVVDSGLEEVQNQLEMCQLDGGDDRDDELPQNEDPTSQLDKGKGKAEDEDDEDRGESDSDESEFGVLGELIYASIENRFPMLKLRAAREEAEAARKQAEAYAAADHHRPVFSITEKQAPRSVTTEPSASFSMLGLSNAKTTLSTSPNISPPPSNPLSAPIPTTAKSRKTPTYTYSRRKLTVRKPPTSIMGHAVTRRDPSQPSPPSEANSTTCSPPPFKTEAGASTDVHDIAKSANGDAATAESLEETRPPLTKSAKKREKLKRKMASTTAPIDSQIDKERRAAKKMRQAAAKRNEAEKSRRAQDGDEDCDEEELDVLEVAIDDPEVTSDNLQEEEPDKTEADDEVWDEVVFEKSGTLFDKPQDKVGHPVDTNASNSNVDLLTPIMESSNITPLKVESSGITLPKESDESPSMNPSDSGSTQPKQSLDDNLPKEEDETLSLDSSDSDSSDGTLLKELLNDNLPEEEGETLSSGSDSSNDSPDPTPLPTSVGPDDRTMYPNLYIDTLADLPFMVPFVIKTPPISAPRHVIKAWHLGVEEVQARVKHYSKTSQLAMDALELLHGSPVPIVEAAKQKCRELNRLYREALMENTRIWFMMADWQVEQVLDADTLDPELPEDTVMAAGKGGLWPEWSYRSAIKRIRHRQRCEAWDMGNTDWTLEWRGDGWYPRSPEKDHANDFESCDLCEEKRVNLKDHVTGVVLNEILDHFNPQERDMERYGEEAKAMLTRTMENCIAAQMAYYRGGEECMLEAKPWEANPTPEVEQVPEHSPNVDDEQEEGAEAQPVGSDSHGNSNSEANGSSSENLDSDRASPPPSEVRLGKRKVAADPFSEATSARESEAPTPKKKSKKKKHHTRKKKNGGPSTEPVNADSDAESHSSSRTVRAPNPGPRVARVYGVGSQSVTMAVHPSVSNPGDLDLIPPRSPPNEYPRGECPSDSESDTSHGPSFPDPPSEEWGFTKALDVYSQLPPFPAFRYRPGEGFQTITYPNKEELDIIAPYECVRIPGANSRKQHTRTFVFNYRSVDSDLPMFWLTDVIEKIMIDHDIIQVPVIGGGYVRAWGPPIYGKWISVAWPQDVEKPHVLLMDLVRKMHKRRSTWNQGVFDDWIEDAMKRAPDYREGEWQRTFKTDW